MTHRNLLVVLGAVVLLGALATSTGGVSSLLVDRSVHVGVTDDPEAYVGFEQTPHDEGNDTTNLTVTLRNQFPGDNSLWTVAVTLGDERVQLASELDPLDPGEQTSYTFENVSCGDPIHILVVGEDVSVYLNRTACE
jgi:hypothetical protein